MLVAATRYHYRQLFLLRCRSEEGGATEVEE
jgi:hypothetical protein